MHRGRIRTTVAAVALALAGITPAAAQDKINLLLDWGWLPYHTVFFVAEERGFYKEAGLEVKVEQGRGSASSAVVVGQGGFDLGHINITNAAQAIAKGVPLKSIAVYQTRSSASFISFKDKIELKGPESLKGAKIGSTPGGSDALSLALFTKIVNVPRESLNVVGLDGAAKRAALLSGSVDVVSGDSHAYGAIVRGTGRVPSILLLSDYGAPLLGFGFVGNETFLKAKPEATKRFLAATRKGFEVAFADPKASCILIQSKVLIPGSVEQCVDYFGGLIELSQSPKDASWGKQSDAQWIKLIDTLTGVGEIKTDKKPADFFTNAYLP